MVKMCAAFVAITILIVPGAWAGTFDALAKAQDEHASRLSFLKPGSVVKAQWQPTTPARSGMQAESDALIPEVTPIAAKPQVRRKPPLFKERSAGAMAPPPRVAQQRERAGGSEKKAATGTEDLESELEKDLVLAPPAPKSEEPEKGEAQAGSERVAPRVKEVVPQKKRATKKATQKRWKAAPMPREDFTVSQRSIRKVRPLSRNNPWGVPAGNYVQRACPVNPVPEVDGARRMEVPVTCPPRVVRDGVTVRLAPRPVQASYVNQEEGSSLPDELLNTASEIIGLPFALISSFF